MLVLDYLSGPYIQLPILLVIPVGLATWRDGSRWGSATAVMLPLIRLTFFERWGVAGSWLLPAGDALVDVVILLGWVWALQRYLTQQRRMRVLQGLLPICAFCKRIRTPNDDWQQLERYITEHSEAEFTHGCCPECLERHYGSYLH